jgi:hypothetical protein
VGDPVQACGQRARGSRVPLTQPAEALALALPDPEPLDPPEDPEPLDPPEELLEEPEELELDEEPDELDRDAPLFFPLEE